MLARFAAPAAFLVAVTIALLLIRSAIHDDPTAPPSRVTPARTDGTRTGRTRTATTPEARQAYTIQRGDTLGSVAERFGTSVEHLVELNPGIDPTGLQVGQTIRVK